MDKSLQERKSQVISLHTARDKRLNKFHVQTKTRPNPEYIEDEKMTVL